MLWGCRCCVVHVLLSMHKPQPSARTHARCSHTLCNSASNNSNLRRDVFVHLDCDVYVDRYVYVDNNNNNNNNYYY